jgi:hypothetical protein
MKSIWTFTTTRTKKRQRRDYRQHAVKMFAAGCPEKAHVWLQRARNG